MSQTQNNNSSPNQISKLAIAGIITTAAAIGALSLYVLTRPPSNKPKNLKNSKNLKNFKNSKINLGKKYSENLAGKGENLEEEDEFGGENGEVPKINKETTVKIFQEMTVRLQHVIINLAREEQQAISGNSNLNVQPEQLQRFLIDRFQASLGQIEAEVYTQFKVTEEEMKVATEAFAEDAQLKTAVNQLKTVYNAVMNPGSTSNVEIPSHMTVQKTLQVLKGTMDILRVVATEIVDELQNKGMDRSKDAQKFNAEFQKVYGPRVEERRANLYKDLTIPSDEVVQAAVLKYQNDATFANELKNYSEHHNRQMAALGFFTPNNMQ